MTPDADTARDADTSRDALAPDDRHDGGDAGSACPYLKCITFEDGFAGVMLDGTPILQTTNPLKGLQSMAVTGVGASTRILTGSPPELWLSFYFRFGQVPDPGAAVFTFTAGSKQLVGHLAGLALVLEGADGASPKFSTLTPGSIYRVVLHTKLSGNGLSLEGYLAPDGDPLGATRFGGYATGASPPSLVQVGTTGTGSLEAVFDDIVVSTSGLPAASP